MFHTEGDPSRRIAQDTNLLTKSQCSENCCPVFEGQLYCKYPFSTGVLHVWFLAGIFYAVVKMVSCYFLSFFFFLLFFLPPHHIIQKLWRLPHRCTVALHLSARYKTHYVHKRKLQWYLNYKWNFFFLSLLKINGKIYKTCWRALWMKTRRALILLPLKLWATPTTCHLNEKSWPLLNTRNFKLQDPLHCLTRKLTSILFWTKLQKGKMLEATSECTT